MEPPRTTAISICAVQKAVVGRHHQGGVWAGQLRVVCRRKRRRELIAGGHGDACGLSEVNTPFIAVLITPWHTCRLDQSATTSRHPPVSHKQQHRLVWPTRRLDSYGAMHVIIHTVDDHIIAACNFNTFNSVFATILWWNKAV